MFTYVRMYVYIYVCMYVVLCLCCMHVRAYVFTYVLAFNYEFIVNFCLFNTPFKVYYVYASVKTEIKTVNKNRIFLFFARDMIVVPVTVTLSGT